MIYISNNQEALDLYAAAYEQLEKALSLEGTGLEDELLQQAVHLETAAFAVAARHHALAQFDAELRRRGFYVPVAS